MSEALIFPLARMDPDFQLSGTSCILVEPTVEYRRWFTRDGHQVMWISGEGYFTLQSRPNTRS